MKKTLRKHTKLAAIIAAVLVVGAFAVSTPASKASDNAEVGAGYIQPEIEEVMVAETDVPAEETETEEVSTEETVVEESSKEVTEEISTEVPEEVSEEITEGNSEEIKVEEPVAEEETEMKSDETQASDTTVEENVENSEEIVESANELGENETSLDEEIPEKTVPEETVDENQATESVMEGSSTAPYFEMSDGNTAYCVEANKTHPADGTEYEGSEPANVDYEELKDIFANRYEIEKEGEEDTELLNKTTQQAIWSKTDKTSGMDYRTNTLIWLGEKATNLFDRLLSYIDLSKYNVSFVEYTTDETDSLGNRYQTLLSGVVEEIPEEVPDEPKTEPEEPEVPEVPEVPEIPETPIEPEVPSDPKPSEPVVETKTETKVLYTYRPTAEKGFLSTYKAPQTGDNNNIILWIVLFILSGFAAVIVYRRMK